MTSPSHGLRPVQRPSILFVVTTSSIYAVSEWTRYELLLAPTSPIQSDLVQVIVWVPNLVTQVFALTAILWTLTFLVHSSSRLFRRPSRCSSLSHLGRLAKSVCSGVVAVAAYLIGVMAIFELWRLDFWTLQVGIVAGAQYPLWQVWRHLEMSELRRQAPTK